MECGTGGVDYRANRETCVTFRLQPELPVPARGRLQISVVVPSDAIHGGRPVSEVGIGHGLGISDSKGEDSAN